MSSSSPQPQSSSAGYAKTAANKLGRLPNRGHYDYATINTIVDTCQILHVSFIDPEHPFPVVLPMIGCTGDFGSSRESECEKAGRPLAEAVRGEKERYFSPAEFEEGEGVDGRKDIYLHGWVSGRLFRRAGAEGGEEGKDEKGEQGKEEGLPVTVAASLMDGLVLTLTPFHNSCNYRSAVCYGHATLVTSEAEKHYAMRRITDNMLPGIWTNSRVPPTRVEMDSTSILRVSVASASAKVRKGGPSEDRKDLSDEQLKGQAWTGVVPTWFTYGVPEQAGVGENEAMGEYVAGWSARRNAEAKTYAYGVIDDQGGKGK